MNDLLEIRTDGAGTYMIRAPRQPMETGFKVTATFTVSPPVAQNVLSNQPLRAALLALLQTILKGEAYPEPPAGFSDLFPAFIAAAERIKAEQKV